MKKLFLLTRDDKEVGYNEYNKIVVCEDNEKEAQRIHTHKNIWDGFYEIYGTWCDFADVTVEEIGEANDNVKSGVVCASFYGKTERPSFAYNSK